MRGLLRSVWDEPRPSPAPRRVWWDGALVAVLVAGAVLEAALRPDLPSRWIAMAVVVGLAPTLLWRRTHPLLVVTIAFAVTALVPVVAGGSYEDLNVLVFVLVLVFSLFRWGTGRTAVIGVIVIVVKIGLSVLLGQLTGADAVGGIAILSAVTAAGAAARYRAGARQRELDRVAMLERERLARDLHDTVAHHVSAMAIRAQAGLAAAESQPVAATDALRLIESEASRALAEMRAMVRILRMDEPADLTPSPLVSDLARLAGRSRTGPVVDVEILGDVDDLPRPVGTAIYRLAQESITNARRHARHATRIEVRVSADETAVSLRVSDDGDTSGIRPTGAPGYGLVGMIERAGLLGGTCQAGPDPDRGWTVTAVLPRTGSAA